MTQPLIELVEVSRKFEHHQALSDVNLTVNANDVVGLVGPNGAGKSTLMRLLLGFLPGTSGTVRTFGLDPWDNPLPVRQRTGYVPDGRDEQSRASIQQLLNLHAAVYPSWDKALATKLLGPVGAQPKAGIHQLSKGQAQHVHLACAMAHRPQLLLLDEPAGGLDPSQRREFLEHAIQLLSDVGSTIVLSSHHLNDVERMANRVVMLRGGRLAVDEELDSLRECYCIASFEARSLLGSQRVDPASVRQHLCGTAGFVASRVKDHRVQAVLKLAPEAATHELRKLGIEATCGTSNLEEVYIILAGDIS